MQFRLPHSLFKKFYKIFGPILSTLLTINIILLTLLVIYLKFIFRCTYWGLNLTTGKPNNWSPPTLYDNIFVVLFEYFGRLALVTIIIGSIYFIFGIIGYFFNRFGQKNKKLDNSVKIMVLRGITGMAFSFILYFVASLIAGIATTCL